MSTEYKDTNETYLEFLERRSSHMARIIGNLQARLNIIKDYYPEQKELNKLVDAAIEHAEREWDAMKNNDPREKKQDPQPDV